jgi:hypothetical protein
LIATGAVAHSKAEETLTADAATVLSVDVIAMRFTGALRITAVSLTGRAGRRA